MSDPVRPDSVRLVEAMDHLIIHLPRRWSPDRLIAVQRVLWLAVMVVAPAVTAALLLVWMPKPPRTLLFCLGCSAALTAAWLAIGRLSTGRRGTMPLRLTTERLILPDGRFVILENIDHIGLDPDRATLHLWSTGGERHSLPGTLRFSELRWLRSMIAAQCQRRRDALGLTTPGRARVPADLTALRQR